MVNFVAMGSFWSIILGGFITIATAFLIERLRRPSLHIFIEQPPLERQNGHARRHLRLKVHNRVSNWFAPWMLPASAAQCRGKITFHHLEDGQNVFDRAMDIRWANSPEPLTEIPPVPRVQMAGAVMPPELVKNNFKCCPLRL